VLVWVETVAEKGSAALTPGAVRTRTREPPMFSALDGGGSTRAGVRSRLPPQRARPRVHDSSERGEVGWTTLSERSDSFPAFIRLDEEVVSRKGNVRDTNDVLRVGVEGMLQELQRSW